MSHTHPVILPALLTNYGAGNPNTSISQVRLGASYGYSPTVTQTNLRGSTVYTTTAVSVCNSSNRQFLIELPKTAGDFTFGELGLFDSLGGLIAIATLQLPFRKYADNCNHVGNTFRATLELTQPFGTGCGTGCPPIQCGLTPYDVQALIDESLTTHVEQKSHLTPEQVNQLISTAMSNFVPPREVSELDSIDLTSNTLEPNGTTKLIPHTFVVKSPLLSNTDEIMTYTLDRGFSLSGWNVLIAKGRLTSGTAPKSFKVSQFTENLIDGADSALAPLQRIGQMIVKLNSGVNKGHIRIIDSVVGDTFTVATDWSDQLTGLVDFEILANEYYLLDAQVNTLGDQPSFLATAPN